MVDLMIDCIQVFLEFKSKCQHGGGNIVLSSMCLSFFPEFQKTNVIMTIDVFLPLKSVFDQDGVLEMVMPHPKGVM
jgi:hypothetical protein